MIVGKNEIIKSQQKDRKKERKKEKKKKKKTEYLILTIAWLHDLM